MDERDSYYFPASKVTLKPGSALCLPAEDRPRKYVFTEQPLQCNCCGESNRMKKVQLLEFSCSIYLTANLRKSIKTIHT